MTFPHSKYAGSHFLKNGNKNWSLIYNFFKIEVKYCQHSVIYYTVIYYKIN